MRASTNHKIMQIKDNVITLQVLTTSI